MAGVGVGGRCVRDRPCGDGETFAARVPDVLEREPDVVIVQGGLNDSGVTAAQVDDTLSGLETVPRVIVVGPPLAPNANHAEVERIDAVLADAAAAHGREYVSALSLRAGYLDDGLHLDRAGHQTLADLIEGRVTAGAG